MKWKTLYFWSKNSLITDLTSPRWYFLIKYRCAEIFRSFISCSCSCCVSVWNMWRYSKLFTLFRNKRFMLDEMTKRNALKFAIFYIYENPNLLFSFFNSSYFIYFPNECPGLCQHRPGHSLGENSKLHKMKNGKKLHGFSCYKNMANFEAFF